jgi:hypothetical protein
MTEAELLATITAYLAQGTRPGVPVYVHPSLMGDALNAYRNMAAAPTQQVGSTTLSSSTLSAYKDALTNYHRVGGELDTALDAVHRALTTYIESRAKLLDATAAIQGALHP